MKALLSLLKQFEFHTRPLEEIYRSYVETYKPAIDGEVDERAWDMIM